MQIVNGKLGDELEVALQSAGAVAIGIGYDTADWPLCCVGHARARRLSCSRYGALVVIAAMAEFGHQTRLKAKTGCRALIGRFQSLIFCRAVAIERHPAHCPGSKLRDPRGVEGGGILYGRNGGLSRLSCHDQENCRDQD
jgi:hypothetical protein